MRIRITTFLSALALLAACSGGGRATEPEETIYVSIPPLKSLVAAIVGEDFPIEVLVPPGASPESFEPTPKQVIAVRKARWLFQIGLIDFEKGLVAKIAEPERVVDLARASGIELLAGSCSHDHGHGHDHDASGGHRHGVDPHLWSSPRALQRMAAAIFETIRAAYPDSIRYERNHQQLQAELAALDRRTAERIAGSGVRSFLVYHPALTYYARDYGLQQIAIESEGKEPSARHLARLIRQAREEGIRRILYQTQFPKSSVAAIADDIGAEAVVFDPLAEDVIANIDAVTEWIVKP